jgi:hypothetical protein
MVSKTSLLPLVRSFDWKAVAASLEERPSLVAHRDERGINWLHLCCATALGNRDARPSIRTADVLLARGIDLNDHAFTEGRWKATPVWFCVAFGRNLRLAEHLLKLGASPDYSLYAAAYNRDIAAIRLLVRSMNTSRCWRGTRLDSTCPTSREQRRRRSCRGSEIPGSRRLPRGVDARQASATNTSLTGRRYRFTAPTRKRFDWPTLVPPRSEH